MKKIILLLFVTVCFLSKAQFDPHFTQYMYNESFINPAYAGSHDALSLTALGRKQWVGFNGAPTNVTFSGHAPVANDKLGIGLNFMNESIGVMKRNYILVNCAYRLKLKTGKFCFGIQGGVNGFSENLTNVNTIQTNDNQFLQNTTLAFAPNVGAGMYYYTKNWYVGFSTPRMLINTTAGTSVSTAFIAPSLSYYLTGGYVFTLNNDYKLKTSAMLKLAAGAPIQPEVNAHVIMKDVFWIGATYRLNDAVAAIIGYQATPQFRIGYSYDYTLSKLQQFNTGSHEIMLNYIFKYKNKNFSSPRFF